LSIEEVLISQEEAAAGLSEIWRAKEQAAEA
jgi:hypothetical protein